MPLLLDQLFTILCGWIIDWWSRNFNKKVPLHLYCLTWFVPPVKPISNTIFSFVIILKGALKQIMIVWKLQNTFFKSCCQPISEIFTQFELDKSFFYRELPCSFYLHTMLMFVSKNDYYWWLKVIVTNLKTIVVKTTI